MDNQPTPTEIRVRALHPQSRVDYVIRDLYAEMGRNSNSSGYLEDVYMRPLLMRFRRLEVPQDEYKAWIRAARQAVMEDRNGLSYMRSATSSSMTNPLTDKPPPSSVSSQAAIQPPQITKPAQRQNDTPTSHILLIIAGLSAVVIWIGSQVTNNSNRVVAPTPTRIVAAAAISTATPYVPPTATAYVLPTATPRPLPTDTPVIQRFAPVVETQGCPNGCSNHPPGCDIKGNISFDSGEKIYHLPYQRYYAATVISPAYGERWFCTEQEAVTNGWRRSRE